MKEIPSHEIVATDQRIVQLTREAFTRRNIAASFDRYYNYQDNAPNYLKTDMSTILDAISEVAVTYAQEVAAAKSMIAHL